MKNKIIIFITYILFFFNSNLLSDENNKILKPNTPCKLFYKGPNVFLGYASNILEMKNNESSMRLLDTGDMAKFKTNNQFILVSRDSRYIKIEDKSAKITKLIGIENIL